MYVICFFLFLVPKGYDIHTVTHTHTHTHTHVTMLLLSDFSPVRVNSLSKSDSTLHGETNERHPKKYLFFYIEVYNYFLNSKSLLTDSFMFYILLGKFAK